MNLLRSATLAVTLPLGLALPASAEEPAALDTDVQKFNYALGVIYGAQIAQTDLGVELDTALVLHGFREMLQQSDSAQMSPEEATQFARAFVEKKRAEDAAMRVEMGQAFLVENGAKDGITTTQSGLQYKVLVEGKGDSPTLGNSVSVHYTGRLLDGTVFDSSIERGEPAEFPVSGVIPGWTEALQLMKPGGKFEVWIPSALAYGERGAGADIGPNEVLNFEMELLAIVGQ